MCRQPAVISLFIFCFTNAIWCACAKERCDIAETQSGGKKLVCFDIKDDLSHYNSSLTEINEIFLYKAAMTSITDDFFKRFNNQSIQTLVLSYGNLSSLNENSFDGLTQLYLLNLTHNKIVNVSDKAFRANHKLTTLSLMSNKIEVLAQNTFTALIDLKTIDLSWNRLKHLPKHIFEHNTNLVTIDLKHNKLVEIPDVNLMQWLSNVDLSFNRIENLSPHTFKNNYALRYLNLRNNTIKNLPPSLYHLNLRELNLLENPLNMSNHRNQEVLKQLKRGEVILEVSEHTNTHKHKKSDGNTTETVYKIPPPLQFVLIGIMVLLVVIVIVLSVLLYHVYVKKKESHKRYYPDRWRSLEYLQQNEETDGPVSISNGSVHYHNSSHAENHEQESCTCATCVNKNNSNLDT